MSLRNIFILAVALVSLSSCSKQLTYLTDSMVDNFRWSESELKQIQFYLSEDIVLVRAYDSGFSDIESGQIKVKSESKVDEVIIRKGTPGTLIFSPRSDRFAVSFDNASENYLMFGPNEKAKGRYVLLAKKWQRRGGVITYGNKDYKTNSDSAYAALMVDISKAKRLSKSSSVASGRRIDGD